jgi:hypothetical protein
MGPFYRDIFAPTHKHIRQFIFPRIDKVLAPGMPQFGLPGVIEYYMINYDC